jgi:DHA2 family multidrug resistance protein
MMPLLPRIVGRSDPRFIVTGGILCFAASCLLDIHLTAQSGGGDFVYSQLLRGVGQILSFMPLNQISVGAVSRADTGDAAGLFNMARNLGGSIGLALQGVFIDRRIEAHADAIRESVSANSLLVQERLASQSAFFAARSGDVAHGNQQALDQLAAQIHQQAMVMTYSDCFFVLGIGLLVRLPLVFVLRRPPALGAPAAPARAAAGAPRLQGAS